MHGKTIKKRGVLCVCVFVGIQFNTKEVGTAVTINWYFVQPLCSIIYQPRTLNKVLYRAATDVLKVTWFQKELQ